MVKGLPVHPIRVTAGHKRMLRAKLINKGNTTVSGGTFQLTPSNATLVTLLPVRKGVTPNWTATVNLAPKKSMVYVAKVQFNRCAPTGPFSFTTTINGAAGPVVQVRMRADEGLHVCGLVNQSIYYDR